MISSRFGRRQFLQGAVAGACAAAVGLRPGFALGAESGKPAAGKIGDFKLSLAEWSLHKALRAKELTNLDFPRIARERFGFEAVEFVNQFFKSEVRNDAYLQDLKRRAADFGVTCVLIMIDGEGDLSAADTAERSKAVVQHKAWVDAAAALGCHAIRVNTGNNYSPTDVGAVADACSSLTEYGVSKNIGIICENHGGPSSDPNALVALMKRVNNPMFGTLPDFGNFPKSKANGGYTIDIYDAIARMMPYARGVSAKSYDFNPEGLETKLDYARILKIVTDAGYKGHVGVEYEGERMSEADGIKATKKLLETIRGANYTG